MVSGQHENFSGRLIRLIESNAEELTQGTVRKLHSSTLTKSYHDLPHHEIYSRAYEVYHNLGRWLWEKSGDAVQHWYNGLGDERCREGIPLTEVLWALVLTKERLLEYVATCAFADSAVELYQQQEFHTLVGHFFDRALCYTAEGYEQHSARHGKAGPTALAS